MGALAAALRRKREQSSQTPRGGPGKRARSASAAQDNNELRGSRSLKRGIDAAGGSGLLGGNGDEYETGTALPIPGQAYEQLLGKLRSAGSAHGSAAQRSATTEAGAKAHAVGAASGGAAAAEPDAAPRPGGAFMCAGGDATASGPATGGGGTAGGDGADRPGAASEAAEGRFAAHFERVLSDEQAAAMLARCEAGGRPLRPAPPGAAAAAFAQAWPGGAWLTAAGVHERPLPLPSAPPSLEAYGFRERVRARWREVAAPRRGGGSSEEGAKGGGGGDFVDSAQATLFALLARYYDVMLPVKPYPTSASAPDPTLDAALLHCVAHCAAAAEAIKRGNEALKAAGGAADPPRDQGYSRAKVLILAPLRSTALRIVLRLAALAQKETRADSVQGKDRFLEEYGGDQEHDAAPAAARKTPAEHRALFHGNDDDHFRIGVKITRGAVKLYADFFSSDVVVASPLALTTLLGDAAKRGSEAPGAGDWLASVEVVLLERADVMLMQNWAHVQTVFERLNSLPLEQHGVDIMRVREYNLTGRAALYRQVIMTSSFASAELNALFNRHGCSHAGKAKLKPAYEGQLRSVVPQVQQLFERLPDAGPEADGDARYKRFVSKLWPRIKESGASGLLIFVPSYFDYVRLRNFLDAENASWEGVCEYTPFDDAARSRAHWGRGRRRLLVYTERAHFYHRYALHGVKDFLFYQLPHHAHYYAELVNMLASPATAAADSSHATVHVLYSKYDVLQLERVVGSMRARKMVKGEATTFVFC